MADIAAWLLLPALFYATSLGLGLLVERVVGLRLVNGLVAPLGFCAAIVLVYPGYQLGVSAWLADVLLVAGSVAGLVFARGGLRERLNPGWAGVAGLAVFLIYAAPTLLHGGWTWGGYNFLNDTAYQFLLIDHIRFDGIPFHPPAQLSTPSISVRQYIETKYPIGTHVHLATLSSLLQRGPEVLYQTYLASMLAVAAMAGHQLARRLGLRAVLAVAAVVVAFAANLTYQYALQGNIKEMGMIATLAIAAALGRELLDVDRPVAWAALGIAFAAALAVFSIAALPYVAALAGCLLIAAFLQRDALVRRSLIPAAGVLVGATVVVALPVLFKLVDFAHNAESAFGSNSPGAPLYGQLQRALQLEQITGVWLSGNYTLPIQSKTLAVLTTAGAIAIVALAVGGVLALVRRRETSALLFLIPALATLVVIAPRVTPYADGKIFAILSPAVILAAAAGLQALAGRQRVLAVGLGAALSLGVLWSAGLAYHDVRLAPTNRMAQLTDLNKRFAGKGLMLFPEFEEFSKYFMRDVRINAPNEPFLVSFIELRHMGPAVGYTYDVDDMTLHYVESFPWIVTRNGPATGRPPANFRLVYQNVSYSVWRRQAGPKVLDHLPIGAPQQSDGEPACRIVERFARSAPKGSRIVAAKPPEYGFIDLPILGVYTSNFKLQKEVGGNVMGLHGPGKATGKVAVKGGTYTVWVRGSFGRPVSVWADGRRVGHVEGINTPRGWYSAGRIELAAGTHTVQVRRNGGSPAPGDGAPSVLGPVTLAAPGPTRLLALPPSRARELCGGRYDWLEIVGPGALPR